MEISRRDFMKGFLAGAVGLAALASGKTSPCMAGQGKKAEIRRHIAETKQQAYKYNKEWEEGIEENRLREEISGIIGKYTDVGYCKHPEGYSELKNPKGVLLNAGFGERVLEDSVIYVKRYGESILKENLPIENLRQIRDYLVNGPPNKNSISMYLGLIDMQKSKNPAFYAEAP